jgi:AcrR family transcriptional regulator
MEKTKASKSSRAKGKANGTEAKIKSAYIDYLLNNGKQPSSIYKFCLDLKLKEDEFYKHFGSFESIEKQIWKGFIDTVTTSLNADKSFSDFSAREKLLAFYFTLAEVLKSNRSFALLQLKEHRRPEIIPTFLKEFKTSFEEFVGGILTDGKSKGEVAERPYLDKRYPQLFWVHFGFLLLYWKDDDSPGFDQTDAFIEKSVNLAFDLIGKGAFDSAIDFAKFLYQSKVK